MRIAGFGAFFILIIIFSISWLTSILFKDFRHSEFIQYCMDEKIIANPFHTEILKNSYIKGIWEFHRYALKINQKYSNDSTYIYFYFVDVNQLYRKKFLPIAYKKFAKKFQHGSIPFPMYNIVYIDIAHVKSPDELVYVVGHELGHFVYLQIADSGFIQSKIITQYKKGQTYQQNEDYKMAIKYYTTVISLWPIFWEAVDNLAVSYSKIGMPNQAIKLYKHSLNVNPQGTLAVQNMGYAFLKMGSFLEAREWFDSLSRSEKNSPEGYFGRGLSFLMQRENDSAIVNFIKAEQLYSNNEVDKLLELMFLIEKISPQLAKSNQYSKHKSKLRLLCDEFGPKEYALTQVCDYPKISNQQLPYTLGDLGTF